MNPRVWIAHTASLAVLLLLLLSAPPLRAADIVELDGTGLSDPEMADIRGGFTLDNGDFMALTLDFVKLQFTSTDALNPNGAPWLNALSQQVRITEEGIEFNMDILQGGDPSSAASAPGSSPLQNNLIGVANSFNGFSGMANNNFISGNNNIAPIVNIFNIQMDIIKGADLANLRPQVADYFLH